MTGNYAGSLGDWSASKQRIRVSGGEEIKALFSAETCRKRARIHALAGDGTAETTPQTQWVGFLPHTGVLKSCPTVWRAY